MNELIALDHFLFLKINREWTHSTLDQLLPILTDLHKILWFKLLIASIIALTIVKFKKKAVGIIVGCLLTLGISDAFTHHVVKPIFKRDRPPIALGAEVELRSPRHAGFSFPSNHAANMFALATFLMFLFPRGKWFFYSIAFVIAYSRIYVGVHFPLDVLAGAILGISIGFFTAKAFQPISKAPTN